MKSHGETGHGDVAELETGKSVGEACFIAILQLHDLANSLDACCCKPVVIPLSSRME